MIRCVDFVFFFFQAEDGIRDLVRSRGLGDVYKRQAFVAAPFLRLSETTHRFKAFGCDSSRRIRPTNTSSLSCESLGLSLIHI